MFNHEYFLELSALSAVGQLSSLEDQQLAEHLRECSSCSDVHLEYAQVIQQQLPQADLIRWRLKATTPAPRVDIDVRTRFLARARTEGIDFSPVAERWLEGSPKPRFSWWHFEWSPRLAIAVCAVCAVGLVWFSRISKLAPRATTPAFNGSSARELHDGDVLQAQLTDLRQTIREESTTIGILRNENSVYIDSQRKVQKQFDEAQRRLEELSGALSQKESEKSALASERDQVMATVTNLRAQGDSWSRERGDFLSEVINLKLQVRNLTASVQEKTSDLERERQLMAASSDVRQLMGARNLHIMDVHDVIGSGKATKAFGRVFYAEGEALVFYAFDLPNGDHNPARYTFQAWGQREPGLQGVRNLGTFEVDDHEQRRWVLKVNDPALLTGIDSVFVTSESIRDLKEPHGDKLMYAYIAGQPNHP